jgi:hypothetical protein
MSIADYKYWYSYMKDINRIFDDYLKQIFIKKQQNIRNIILILCKY